MKDKMSYKKKKIAIIIAVIVVLIAAISVGTYYFIRGNDNTQAAYTEENQNLTSTNNGEFNIIENPEEQTNTAEEEKNENVEDESQGEENIQEPTEVNNNTDNTSTNTTDIDTTDGNNEGSQNEEYTQVDTVETEVEKLEKEVKIGWLNNIKLSDSGISNVTSTNIKIEKPELLIDKTATVLNSSNESINTNAVQDGNKIKYDITVTNDSNVDATGINISDTIPKGTKFETATDDIKPDENGRLLWVIEKIPGKTSEEDTNNKVEISFTVIVEDTENQEEPVNEIRNMAVVDGKNSPETVNPIITTSMETELPEGKTTVEPGDEITYNIMVKNLGTENAVVTVKDSIPTGTTVLTNSITHGGTESNSEITWNIDVEKDITLSFKVKVDESINLSGPISNEAYVNGKQISTIYTDVNAHILFITDCEDEGVTVDKIDNIAGYEIENRNMPTPQRTGYTLEGWYTDKNFTTEVTELPEKMVAGTTRYYAKWKVNSYTITYKIVGDYFTNNQYKVETYDYGETITPVAEPSQTGYTFNGWSTIPQTMPAENIEIEGSYTINSYTITYKITGDYFTNNQYKVETYDYGETITPVAEPSQTGYTFSGWSTIPPTMPAYDIEVVGSYTRNPSLTLTKKALDVNKDEITELVYNANADNYMYYRLRVENTIIGSNPETVDNQTMTDVLPLGMTYAGSEGDGNVSTSTVTVDREQRTQITWKVSGIGNGNAAKEIDIKVKLDEQVFKGTERVEETEQTVISNITAERIEDDFPIVDKYDLSRQSMSLFVRFASPTSGNSGYLFAGTTVAAEKYPLTIFSPDMLNGNEEVYVPGYDDSNVNSNIEDEAKLATMLDDFVDANNNGFMSKYISGGKLPTTADVNKFLKENYNISLSDNQVVLWYKVKDTRLEKECTRTYRITNNITHASYEKDVEIPASSYHMDGIIVDVKSLGQKIPNGASANISSTVSVDNASGIWSNNTSTSSIMIYYNEKTKALASVTKGVNLLSREISELNKENINTNNSNNAVKTIEKTEIVTENGELDKTVEDDELIKNETDGNVINQSETTTEDSNIISSENIIDSDDDTEKVVEDTEIVDKEAISDNKDNEDLNDTKNENDILEETKMENETSN